MSPAVIPENLRADVETLWNYHHMHQDPRPVDVGIGLGGHDLGVATYTAELYLRGLFPLIVFTGANAPTTVDRFPRGEAVHYREQALALGVPAEAVVLEPRAIVWAVLSGLGMALLAALVPVRTIARLAPADVFRK